MKKFPKFVSILLSVLCIALFIFGIFGYSEKYGDVTTTMVSGVTNLYAGLGIEKYIELTYTYDSADSRQLDELKSVLSKRLAAYDINDYVISTDADGKHISILMPWGSKTAYSASIVFSGLNKTGSLVIREASDTDEEGNPTGEIICTNDCLVKAEAALNTYYSSLYKNEFTLTFSGEAKEAIKTFTEKAIASSDNSQGRYSVWIDGNLINTSTFSKVISDGVLNCGDSSYTYTASTTSSYETYAIALSGGVLPFELTQETIYYHSSPNYSERLTSLLWGIAAVCVFTSVYWIVKYKLLGVSAFISLTGFLGTVVMIFSGSFYSSTGIYLTASSAFSVCGSIVIVTLCLSFLMYNIANTLKIQSPSKAVKAVIGSRTKKAVVITVLLLALSVIMGYVCKLLSVLTVIQELANVLAICSVCGFIFIILVFRWIALSISGFDKLNREELFGGARK